LRRWRQKGKKNGVLLIVAPTEHKVRIEIGYGLEGTLTDAESRAIIERDILPDFRLGLFDRAYWPASPQFCARVGVIRRGRHNRPIIGGKARSTQQLFFSGYPVPYY
jgi:TLP18.3/Psb32/MOLO-1 phosphatase superfamily protein